jgi:hypothetical protein
MAETVFFKTIADRPEDFFVCVHCDSVNLYDNESCYSCGVIPKINQKGSYKVKRWVQKEIIHYEDSEGLDYVQIEHLTIEVK